MHFLVTDHPLLCSHGAALSRSIWDGYATICVVYPYQRMQQYLFFVCMLLGLSTDTKKEMREIFDNLTDAWVTNLGETVSAEHKCSRKYSDELMVLLQVGHVVVPKKKAAQNLKEGSSATNTMRSEVPHFALQGGNSCGWTHLSVGWPGQVAACMGEFLLLLLSLTLLHWLYSCSLYRSLYTTAGRFKCCWLAPAHSAFTY